VFLSLVTRLRACAKIIISHVECLASFPFAWLETVESFWLGRLAVSCSGFKASYGIILERSLSGLLFAFCQEDVFFSFTFHPMLEFWRLGSAARSAVFMTPHSSFAFLHPRISSFSVFWRMRLPKLGCLGFKLRFNFPQSAAEPEMRRFKTCCSIAVFDIRRDRRGDSPERSGRC
jgi:hypothetical protein